MIDLLLKHGATPLKEPGVEKEKVPKKAGSKKKVPEKGSAKKYVLTVFKDGTWRPLTPEEMKEFIETNKEVGSYLKKPETLSSLKTPPVSESVPIYDHWDKAAK